MGGGTIDADVHGVADAKPHGFGNLMPAMSNDKSTVSMSVKNIGNFGSSGTVKPYDSCKKR